MEGSLGGSRSQWRSYFQHVRQWGPEGSSLERREGWRWGVVSRSSSVVGAVVGHTGTAGEGVSRHFVAGLCKSPV